MSATRDFEEDVPRPGKGHNGVDGGRLRSLVQRIERLEEEKAAIAGDIKEVYAEAKSGGYDTNVIRQAIRLRRMDKADRIEQAELLDLYLHALGDLADTPLGGAAMETYRRDIAAGGDGDPAGRAGRGGKKRAGKPAKDATPHLRLPAGLRRQAKRFVDGLPTGSSIQVDGGVELVKGADGGMHTRKPA